MNRERMKQLLPVMQAFAEGKDVQFKSGIAEWQLASCPRWEDGRQYRIAPDPPRSLFRIEDQTGARYDGGQYSQQACDELVAAWNPKETKGRVFRTVEYVEKVDA